MLPLILVSPSRDETDRYINQFVTKHSILPYNLIWVAPPDSPKKGESKELSIDQIRELKKRLRTADPGRRLVIIMGLGIAGAEAQNALLKSLEEKNDTIDFIIPVTNAYTILPTIRSRSLVVTIGNAIPGPSSAMQTFVTKLIPASSPFFLSDPLVVGMNQESSIVFFDELLVAMRGLLPTASPETSPRITAVMKDALHTKSLVISNNLNPQLAIDGLLLRAIK